MEMKLYSEFAKNKEDIKPHVVQPVDYDGLVYVEDHYCVNPLCHCTQVILIFYKLEDNEITDILFEFNLDLVKWNATDIKIHDKKIKGKAMIREYIDYVDRNTRSIKEKYISRQKEAKEYGRDNMLEVLDPSIMDRGEGVCYSDLFGDEDQDKFVLNYNDAVYFIDDQYCIHPDCKCSEVFFSFAKANRKMTVANPEFSFKLDINTFSYVIDYHKYSEKRALEIAAYFMENEESGIKEIIKSRYKQMKAVGAKLKAKYRKVEKIAVQSSPGVGRNDPCPCGSGKKYKKCCGN